MASKRIDLQREKDRISDLPDPIIHHILSFLPSTKIAIQTSVLSKRWQKQWTHVPVIIFDFSGMSSISDNNVLNRISSFIDNTLFQHNFSIKINKFHLHYPPFALKDPQLDSKILFAIRKHVEELNLSTPTRLGYYVLPKFFFNNDSLVKLTISGSTFSPNNLNWGFLTTLSIRNCKLNGEAMEQIFSGSPSLESFEFASYGSLCSGKLVIASKSLKRFVLEGALIRFIEISCPNLEELSFNDIDVQDSKMFRRAVENVMSSSSSIRSFEIINCVYGIASLLIASKSLKRLVLRELNETSRIEFSCPKLEKLKLFDCMQCMDTAKLLNLPNSLSATFDFYYLFDDDVPPSRYEFLEEHKGLIKDILQQLHHVKKLKLGIWFMEILSAIEVEEGLISPMLNIKCLTLIYPYLNRQLSGIAWLLRNSPVLEKLVIQFNEDLHLNLPKMDDVGKNYWNLNATVFDYCLVSHLKTIKIIGFPKKDYERKLVLNFIQFLLKNASVLEKMVVILLKDDEIAFQLEVSRELLNVPKCSPNATIELLCSNNMEE